MDAWSSVGLYSCVIKWDRYLLYRGTRKWWEPRYVNVQLSRSEWSVVSEPANITYTWTDDGGRSMISHCVYTASCITSSVHVCMLLFHMAILSCQRIRDNMYNNIYIYIYMCVCVCVIYLLWLLIVWQLIDIIESSTIQNTRYTNCPAVIDKTLVKWLMSYSLTRWTLTYSTE